jgi:SH3-like domain-containing protein
VRRRDLLLLGAAMLVPGCEWAGSALTGEPPFWPGDAAARTGTGIAGEVEWSGQQAGAQGRVHLAARTEEEWRRIWDLTGQEPPGPLPEGWMAVAVFAGARSTGGHSVGIRSVEPVQRSGSPPEVRVVYRIRAPAQDAMVTQALTSPWAVRIVPELPGPVRFTSES